MERSKAGTKKKSRRPITTLFKYNVIEHNMALFFKIMKNFNEIQLTKNKMDTLPCQIDTIAITYPAANTCNYNIFGEYTFISPHTLPT